MFSCCANEQHRKTVDYCFAIFNYGLWKAKNVFAGREAYGQHENGGWLFLRDPCKVKSILTYDTLMEVVEERGEFSAEQLEMLKEWRKDPFSWGTKHGFPKVEK